MIHLLPVLFMQGVGAVSMLHGVFRTNDTPIARAVCFFIGFFMIFLGSLV